MPDIRVGDEIIRFPDSMTDEEIQEALRRLFPPPEAQAPAQPVASDQPELPVVARPEPVPPFEEQQPVVRDRIEQEVQRRVDAELERVSPGADQSEEARAAERARLEVAIRPTVERSFGQVFQAGGPGLVSPQTDGIIPFFRPSRISVQTDGTRLYADPTKGRDDPDRLRAPTPREEFTEAFAQQQIMTEQQAQQAALGGRAPEEGFGLLQQVEPGFGVFEGPVTAATRSTLGLFGNALGEIIRGPLTYEVPAEAAEQAEQLRSEAFTALTDTDEGYLASLGTYMDKNRQAEQLLLNAPDVDTSDVGYKLAYLRSALRLPSAFTHPYLQGLAIPLPGQARVAQPRTAYDVDPEGRRTASEVEVPSFLEDPGGFAKAETVRLARNISAGRTIGDEYRDLPLLSGYYDAVWGDPDAAYYVGLAGEASLPIGPGFVYRGVKPVVTGTGRAAAAAAPKVVRSLAQDVKAVGEAAARTTMRTVGVSDTLLDAAKVSAPYNRARAAAAQAAEVTGDYTRAVYRASQGKTDPLIIRKVTERVLKAAGVEPDVAAKAVAALRPTVSNWVDAFEDVVKGLSEPAGEGTGVRIVGVSQEQLQNIQRGLKLGVPDDFVMVTEDIAAPRSIANRLKEGANAFVRSQIARDQSSKAAFLESALNKYGKQLTPALRSALAQQAARLEALTDAREIARLDKQIVLALQQVAKTVPDAKKADVVGNFRTKPMNEIKQTLPEVLRSEIPVNVRVFADLDPNTKKRLVEALKETWIGKNAGGLARNTMDVGAMQIYLDRSIKGISSLLDFKLLNTPFTRNMLALFGGKLDDTTKFSVDMANAIRRAGRGRTRKLVGMLEEQIRDVNTVLKATLAEGKQLSPGQAAIKARLAAGESAAVAVEMLAARAGRVSGIAPRQMWEQVFSTMFNPKLNRKVLADVLAEAGFADKLDLYPTVASINAIARAAQELPRIRWAGRTVPFSDDALKHLLAAMLEGPVRDAAARGIITRELSRKMNLTPYIQKMISDDAADLTNLIFDPAVQAKVAEESRQLGLIFPVSRPLGTSRLMPGVDTEFEKVIADGGGEFLDVLNYVAPQHRPGLFELFTQSASYLLQQGQMGIRQAAKYGYAIPNIPFLIYKGLEAPFVAASQVGVATAAKGLANVAADTVRYAKNVLGRRNTTGGGLTTVDGVYYTPSDLAKLAEQEGLGYTAVESERVSLALTDMLSDLKRRLGTRGDKLLDTLNPVTKTFWIRTAEAMERSFRTGVFEARLAMGDTVRAAGEAARKSLFDYDEVPELLRAGVLPQIFQGAAGSYKITSEMALLALKNPRAMGKYMRALDINRKNQDPLGLEGDAALLNLRIPGTNLYQPVPGSAVIGRTVIAARHADNLVAGVRAARKAVAAKDPYTAMSEVGILAGLPFVYTVVDAAIGPVLDSFEAFEGADPYPTAGQARDVSDEKIFWAAALYAVNQDPTGMDGAYEDFRRFYDVKTVQPPPERAHPQMPRYWAERPEGMPYVFRGRTAPTERNPEGLPIYEAIEMGPRGKRNLGIVRAIDPADLRRFFPTVVATYTGDTAFADFPGIGGIKRVNAERFLDETGQQEALNLFFNPTGIDYSKPEEARAAQAREILRARTPLTPE